MKLIVWDLLLQLNQLVSYIKYIKYEGVSNNPYIQFKVYDIPNHIDLDDFCKKEAQAVQRCGSVVYIIDAKATPYEKACESFIALAAIMMKVSNSLLLIVLVFDQD